MGEARFEDLQIVEMGGRDALTWRQFHADAGEFHDNHRHYVDHLTMLVAGELTVTLDGVDTHYAAPATLLVPVDTLHRLTATVDGTSWLCVFLIPPSGDARRLSLEAL